MRIQLWSYNYDPEPTGIGPVSRVWAESMTALGHQVEVIAAHPHYPEPVWPRSPWPYREVRNGIRVVRLPLAVGRDSRGARLRQEASYAAALCLAAPWLGRPDVIVAVSPSLPALVPAMMNARIRQVPWVLWLQDLVVDAAGNTGILDADSPLVRISRRVEAHAYRSAAGIAVICETFQRVLGEQGVPDDKVRRIYNPATMPVLAREPPAESSEPTLLSMGNIGHSQGLDSVVRMFEGSSVADTRSVRLLIAGHGTAAAAIRSMRTGDRIEMPGVLTSAALADELRRAALGIVSQRSDIEEFNMPSKLMNLMGQGVPVLACVRPESEVARLVARAGAGWVVSPDDQQGFDRALAEALDDPAEAHRRGRAGHAFACAHFRVDDCALSFEDLLLGACAPSPVLAHSYV